MNQRQVVDLNLATSRDSRTGQAVRGQDLPTDEPLEFLADDEQTLSDSTIMVLGLDSGESS